MPLIMDQDLDDLFGDHADVSSIQIPQPLPNDLLKHLDNLRSTGCCQRIAWSKIGVIAWITDNDCGVSTRYLFCNPDNGQWALSQARSIEGVASAHGGNSLVHLSWSHRGNELAIFDAVGRISILNTLNTSLAEFYPTRKCVVDVEDQLSAVVGLMWLNPDSQFVFHESASKENAGHWSFAHTSQKLLGPYHPTTGLSALVTITKSSIIRLLIQKPDRGWHEVKTELDTCSVSSELLTHATVAAHRDGTMLIATHSSDHQLALYCMSIDFQSMSFRIQHLQKISDCFPRGVDTNETGVDGPFPSAQLSHLEYFPQGPESRGGEPSRPFVLGCFSDVSGQYHESGGPNSPFSVVCRWELHSVKSSIHSSFENLGSKSQKAAKTELPTDVIAKRLPDTYIPKIFLFTQQFRLSTLLAIAFSDGSVEIRDRITMEVVARDNDHKQVSGLAQAGFEFPLSAPRLHVALSPNLCAIASLDKDNKVSLGLLQIPATETVNEAWTEAILRAFVLQFSTSCTSFGNYQADLLASMQQHVQQHQNCQRPLVFLNELYRALDIRLDHALEPQAEWLFTNTILPRPIGTQLSLGYYGKNTPRSLPTKIAQGFLDIRLATLAMTYNLRKPKNEPPLPDVEKAEELRTVTGVVQWCTSFMSFVVNELFRLSPSHNYNERNAKPILSQESVQTAIQANSTPALSLLLLSSSRLFLKYACRSLIQYVHEANNIHTYPSPLRDAYQAVVSILGDSPVNFHHFSKMLDKLDRSIKETYQSKGLGPAERTAVEKQMLVGGSVPEVLMPAVTELLTTLVDTLYEEIDVAELYFYDFSWLDLGGENESGTGQDDPAEEATGRRKQKIGNKINVDAVRKIILKADARLKRCVRCCAVTEDGFVSRNRVMQQQLVRTCPCADWWADAERTKSG